MKRKVAFKSDSSISYLDLTDDDIIGIEFNSGTRKFVSKISYTNYATDSVVNNGYDSLITRCTIQELLTTLKGLKKVYTFDDCKSLYKWMAKEKLD